ncbi:MAG: histidine phosphatase family protein [Pseudomonadota bacterium]
MGRLTRRGLLVTALSAAALPLRAQAKFALLEEPYTHAIMRHALAPGTGDPSQFTLHDCATQRNLSDRGRAQARAIGAALRDGGARFDAILSSQWCRCLETAGLLSLGLVTEEPLINSFFQDRAKRGPQTRGLTEKLHAMPPEQTLMLVTHQVNVTALLNTSVSSGETFLFRAHPGETPEVLERFLIPA